MQYENSLKSKQKMVAEMSPILAANLGNIEKVSYEVYVKPEKEWTQEYLVIHFVGGGILARTCNGNSKSAILSEIAKYVNGGYYDEVSDYMHYENAVAEGTWVKL